MLEALVAVAFGTAQLGWRAGTPEPILDANPRWVELYWKAWENLHGATFEEKEPGPWPPRSFAPNEKINYDHALTLALYARWGWRAHPVRETLTYALEQVNENGYVAQEFGIGGKPTGEAAGPPLASLASYRLWRMTGNDADLLLQMGSAQRRYAYLAEKYAFTIEEDGGKPARLGYRVPTAYSCLPMPSESPGEVSAEAAGLLLQEAAMLSNLRAAAGDRQASNVMSRVASELATKLASLWRPDSLRFAASDVADNVERDSLAPMIGLIGGRLPPAIAQDALRGLFDPNRFYRRTLFPTTARTDAAYNGGANARPLLSYLALRALVDNGMQKEAGRAAEHMLGVYEFAAGKDLALYDVYGAETRTPAEGASPNGLEAGTIVIAGLMEAVIGIDVDAKSSEVTWFLRRVDRHGVRNLRFADNVVTLIASARGRDEMPTIQVECEKPFTLKAAINGKAHLKRFGPGKSEWTPEAQVE
jgi:hypothetical protein